MTKVFAIIAVFLLMLPAFSSSLNAQTQVTGHIVAEVVETIGASTKTNDCVVVSKNKTAEKFNLGEVTINSRALTVYDLIIETTDISRKTGTQAALLAKTYLGNLSPMLDADGKHTFRIYGSFEEEPLIAANEGLTAVYKIILAFN